MADATKATARLSVTWPIPRPPAVCEKNIFHLFHYTQPVENYPYLVLFFSRGLHWRIQKPNQYKVKQIIHVMVGLLQQLGNT